MTISLHKLSVLCHVVIRCHDVILFESLETVAMKGYHILTQLFLSNVPLLLEKSWNEILRDFKTTIDIWNDMQDLLVENIIATNGL